MPSFKHSFSIPGVNTSQVYPLWFLGMDIHFGKQVEEQHSARVVPSCQQSVAQGLAARARLLLCSENPVVIASSRLL